ncbi:MAG: alpha/beta hydrolase [Flavobacteriaceae bacterium]|nr:alpha/beta hydrolase [Flavobacteriaceae bacterium]
MKIKFIPLLIAFISTFSFAQEKNYSETEIAIPTNSVTINGTLLSPNSKEMIPLVILIPGSGPTDRDGNNISMKNNSLRFLAEDLAKENIAVYRYDKSVLSFTKEDKEKIDSLTFKTFIHEAQSVISYFKNKNKYSKIIVAGHSQGSLVGMIAAQNNADAFISLEGAGRTIDEILVEQIGLQAPFLKEETQRVLTELKAGKTVEEFNPMLNSLFNKSVQPFLISWIKYNPQIEIKKLTIPVLIINGSKDIQVNISDAELLHQAIKNSNMEIIEGMNHIFKEIKGDMNENILSYTNPDLSIMKTLTEIISTFIKK